MQADHVTSASELASQTPLARSVCLLIFIFWLIRLGLQAVFDVKEHLTAWWLRLGYRILTVLFTFLCFVYGWAVFAAFRR